MYRSNLSSTRGGDPTSRAKGSASPLMRKISKAASIKSQKKADQKIQREISYLKAKGKKLEEKRSASEEADEPRDITGDQFGGCKFKEHKKRYD